MKSIVRAKSRRSRRSAFVALLILASLQAPHAVAAEVARVAPAPTRVSMASTLDGAALLAEFARTGGKYGGYSVGSNGCTTVTKWYVGTHTSLVYGGGNGGDVAANLVRLNPGRGLSGTTIPTAGSIFSTRDPAWGASARCGNTLCGHTGLVLSVNGSQVQIMETGSSLASTSPYAKVRTITWKSTHNVVFVDLTPGGAAPPPAPAPAVPLFLPGAGMTRGDVADYLYRYADMPLTPGTQFAGDPRWAALNWMLDAGIATTLSGDSAPTQPAARNAVAAFVYRLAGSPAFTPPVEASFADVAPGDPFYREIEWLAATGISRGTNFDPSTTIARWELVTWLHRLAGTPSVTLPATSPYPDVSTRDTFYTALIWAQSEFITKEPFTDLGSSAYSTQVRWMRHEGITTGNADGTYGVGANLSRAAFAAFAYRYAGSPDVTPPTTPTFTDVPASHTFHRPIEWLVAAGIASPANTYAPDGRLNRDAMAAFFYRMAGRPDYAAPSTPTMPDIAGSPFRTEIEWVVATGIMSRYPNGSFNPGSAVTRDGFASMLYRFAKFQLWG